MSAPDVAWRRPSEICACPESGSAPGPGAAIAGPLATARAHYNQTVPDDLTLTVQVFSSLRERLGVDRCVVRAPSGARPEQLWPLLPEPIRRATPPRGVRYAVNDTWANNGAPLADGDRIAIILPVSGG